jgi:hypothetical protein
MDEENKVIKEDGETFPFICDCKGFYECEYSLNGICLCPECDKDLIDQYEKMQTEGVEPSRP